MEQYLKNGLWDQFGASIDMLENAMLMCPDDKWDTPTEFWYMAYHTLFFLDYYLSPDAYTFHPPAPFDLGHFDDVKPGRAYTREQLLFYLRYNRQKCFDLIHSLTSESGAVRWRNQSKTMDYSIVELLMYNMRHVQHHAAQLNLLLRQQINDAPDWVSRAGEK